MVSTQFCNMLFIAKDFAIEGSATGAAFKRNATITVASDPVAIMYFSSVEYKIKPLEFCVILVYNNFHNIIINEPYFFNK